MCASSDSRLPHIFQKSRGFGDLHSDFCESDEEMSAIETGREDSNQQSKMVDDDETRGETEAVSNFGFKPPKSNLPNPEHVRQRKVCACVWSSDHYLIVEALCGCKIEHISSSSKSL